MKSISSWESSPTGKVRPSLVEKLDLVLGTNCHKGIPPQYFSGYTNEDIACFKHQFVLEYNLFKVFARASTYSENIVYGGGVALNCVANTKLQRIYPNLWIMNPGDCGGSLGSSRLAYGKGKMVTSLSW